jgi:hypothetical protein
MAQFGKHAGSFKSSTGARSSGPWKGIGAIFKRTGYKQAASRPEFDRTGIYILVGTSDDSALPKIYIGEAESVKKRLDQHYSKKDFWDWAVFFVTKDNSLNKAHVKYLESRLVQLAVAAKQSKLDNTSSSRTPTLSEMEQADVDSFLIDMLDILPLLGLSVFEKTQTTATTRRGETLYVKAKGIRAMGYESAKGFVVLSGSEVVLEETAGIRSTISILRKDLIEQAIVERKADKFLFVEDYIFSSPSYAAAVVLARNANGRTEWKNEQGISLKKLQEAAIDNELGDV